MKSPLHIALATLGLSCAAAISLGLSRFSFALLLPPMREDLQWSYFLAGSMNTANAFGYLSGALVTPLLLQRMSTNLLLLVGALATAIFMLFTALSDSPAALLMLRYLAGIASAFSFVTGGILTTRLGNLYGRRIGLILGTYYGGAGLGIVLSAQLIPQALSYGQRTEWPRGWQIAWITLAALCILLTIALAKSASTVHAKSDTPSMHTRFRAVEFGYGLVGYGLFGVGYIGYMTFIVAFLREHGMATSSITAFYTLLGIGVCMSSFLWAWLLDRYKDGRPMAILNLLLSIATAIPLISDHIVPLFFSGLLFGSVFLSVVASTTALVRHNVPPSSWSSGISAFTTVFALGQIVGPSITGWLSDGQGGLERGFIFSAMSLFAGSVISLRQRHVAHKH